MEFKDVVSSNVKRIGYENKKLYVQFKSGAIYFYKDVPATVYKEMLNADSKGKYLNAQVKGKYEYQKI